MSVAILRGDARHIPLPDGCVDLVVTSPPYFGLRSYLDAGEHYGGQIGSESTPAEWLAALVECTREWVRVLKPEGSIFINLGDKYAGSGPGSATTNAPNFARHFKGGRTKNDGYRAADTSSVPTKSLLGLPWRYALACTDQLGLILRRDIIWAKPNGLPESVTDRCRSSHEYVFHLVRSPRYYAAVDEIREPHTSPLSTGSKNVSLARSAQRSLDGVTRQTMDFQYDAPNPLGKLPGSVWSIPSQPLTVPAHLGIDHFAAFPVELPRRIVLGWSPPGVCTACGQGRRPVVTGGRNGDGSKPHKAAQRVASFDWAAWKESTPHTITGYVCACTPYTDHPGTGETSGPGYGASVNSGAGYPSMAGRPTKRLDGGGGPGLGDRPKVGPWREYHLDGWQPPPTRPALVLDPFCGTGTTLLAAAAYGRHAVGVDRSADYCRLAQWRVHDPAERAKAMQVPKPPPVPDGMEALF